MRDLNDSRKAEAYGDIIAPDLDAEDVATEIEQYVEKVKAFIDDLVEDEQ